MESDKAWETWMMELSVKAPKTRITYIRDMKRFLKRWEIPSTEALFKMKLEGDMSPDPRDHRRVENMVKVQMSEMRKAGYSASSSRLLGCAMRSFFDSQNLELKIKAKDKPKGEPKGQKLILHAQIREMLDNVPYEYKERNKALIMFLKDSGLRVSDVSALNVGDYLDAFNRYNELGEVFKDFGRVYIEKTKTLAYVHIGPEAVETVEIYLEKRREKEGKLPRDAPLFMSLRRSKGGRLTGQGISTVIIRLRDKLREGKNISAHSYRKFHQTFLESSGMPKNWIAKLQGKKIRDSTGPYSQPEEIPGELSKAYMKSYDRLRVYGPSEEERDKDRSFQALTEKVARLEEENKELRARTPSSDEFEALKRDNAWMKNMIKTMKGKWEELERDLRAEKREDDEEGEAA